MNHSIQLVCDAPETRIPLPLGKTFDLRGCCTIGAQILNDPEPLCAVRDRARDLESLERRKSTLKSERPTIGVEKRRVE